MLAPNWKPVPRWMSTTVPLAVALVSVAASVALVLAA
jgi:hypothetical protein